MTDKELGLQVFKSYWTWSKNLYPGSFKISWDDFLKFYGNKTDIYLDGIGGGVRAVREDSSLSDSRIDSAMRSLALSSNGKIPKDPMVMFKFLSNEAVKVDWVDAASFAALESLKDIGTGAQAVGESIITSGKILTYLLPVIVIGVVFFFLDGKSGGKLSGAVKGLRK